MIEARNSLSLAMPLLAGLVCFQWTEAAAQDPFAAGDPFAVPGEASAANTNTPSNMDATGTGPASAPGGGAAVNNLEDDDPLVRLLRSNPPKTPAEFAETLNWMARLRRWDEVGRYLDQLQRANWGREQLAALSEAGGADLWFKLRDTTTELTDAQRSFVRDVAALPAQLSRDPAWIDAWILRLSEPSLPAQRQAQSKLLRAHRAGIERLCHHLLNGHPRVPGNRLVDALLAFEIDGVDALRAACACPDVTARSRVLLAVAHSSASGFGVELGCGLESRALSAETRQALSAVLSQKHDKLPTQNAVRDYVLAQYKRALDSYQIARARPARVPAHVFRAFSEGGVSGVRVVEAPFPDRALETLAELALHRGNMAGASREEQIDCTTVLAQHAYQFQTTRLPIIDLPDSSDFWKQVFDRSNVLQMHGASILSVQAMGSYLASGHVGDKTFDYLAACLRDSRPVVRYLAVDALATADLTEPYTGSAAVLETAIEMSRLGRGPLVLILGATSDYRLAAQQQLLAIGCESILVGSTADALAVLDRPYPVELILVVDRLPRNSLLSAVDRLRHSKRGGALPIAVLTEEMGDVERQELAATPGVVLSVLSERTDQMPRILAEARRLLDTRPMTEDERSAFAERALSFLAKIASDRQRYGFYSLARWEKELADISDAMPTETYLSVLGGMGTATSQQELVSLAADRASQKEQRLLAAEDFERSVRTHGLLLSAAAIQKAYDAYNAQGPTDSVTVAALGRILDTIETKTGRGSTSLAP